MLSRITLRFVFQLIAAITALLTVGAAPSVADESRQDKPVLLTGQSEDGNRPFLFPVGAPRRGIHFDIAKRISELSGLDIRWGVYPATRGRHLFDRCDLQLEFGVSPSWYSEEERENSHFSEPFRAHMDVIAYAGVEQDLTQTSLEGELVLAVDGYRYPTFTFSERFDVDSERTIVRMLGQGRAKAGILEKTVGQFLAKDMGVEIHFAQEVQSTDLSLRLHKCAAEHLPALNKAIKELKSSGEIDLIMESYLNPAD